MALAGQLTFRNLRARPGRTLLSILGIALGVAIASGILVLDYNTVEGLRRSRTNEALPDLMLRAPQGAGSIEALRQTEGVSLAIEGFQESALVGNTETRGRGQGIRLLAFESERLSDFGLVHMHSGRSLEASGKWQVLLGESLAESLGVALGDSVWLSRPPRLGRKVCEEGQLVEVASAVLDEPVRQSFEVVGLLARTGLGRTASGQIAVVGLAQGKSVFEGKRIRSTYWAKRSENVDPQELETNLAQTYALEVNRGTIIGQAADERAFRTGVRVAGLFALVLGLFVIFHTLSMSLTERVVEVGTLHALGASRFQIAGVFFREALIQAALGGVLGVLLGLALAKGLLTAGLTTLGAGKHIDLFVVPWGGVIGLACAGVGVALCGSVYPLMLLGGADPGAALRGDREVRPGRQQRSFAMFFGALMALLLPGLYFALVPSVGVQGDRMALVILGAVGVLVGIVGLALIAPRFIAAFAATLTRPLISLFPFSARMARAGMLHSPGRIGASASAVALVAAGFVGLQGLTDGLRGEIDTWASEAVEGKVWVRELPATDFAALSAHLMQDEAVLGVEIGHAQINVPFMVVGIDVDAASGYGPLATDPELRNAMKNGHGIILSRRLAKDGGREIGDAIFFEKSNHELQPFRVLAHSDAYGHWSHPDERMYGIVDRHYLERYFCVDSQTVDRVAVTLQGGEDTERVHALLQQFYERAGEGEPGGWKFETGSQIHGFHRKDLQRDFRLFDILILLSAGLAALGVLNGQLLAALERAKELGITRALGASQSQVAGMLLIEGLVLALVGGLLGVVIGLAVVPPVVAAVESLSGLDLPHVIRFGVIVQGLVGALLVGFAACLYPMYRIRRSQTLRAVRTG